ncbi:MAG: cation:proton antiporter [Ignavibacterium sp.]|nr:cation:proton antiporter [Ignavibacterium sp.]
MKLPFTDPVIVFTIIITIILFVPYISNRLKIPSIVGLILTGMIVGPNGMNLILRDNSVILFGTVGLLYIMFLAGLEIELQEFKENKQKSIVFGLLTFSIPMLIGTLGSIYILNYNITTSILLASMFASHTLLTYPLVSKVGLTKISVVNLTVGGTIITDTLALLILAVIASSKTGNLDAIFWLKFIVSSIVFLIIVNLLVPKVIRWFFKNIEDQIAQFLLVIATIFFAALLSLLAGLEPIIGAFFAGLALNRLIPHNSPLMNRIEFVGNALFIPFFLLGVGMILDYKVIFSGKSSLIVSAFMVIVATLSKWLAAYFTQKIYNYSADERNIIFGLSNSQAAATLAAVTVGYRLGIFNIEVLNGTIVMILVTCFISSFVTNQALKHLILKKAVIRQENIAINQRILVPISHPNTVESLISLAMFIKDENTKGQIYPLTVVKDDSEYKVRVLESYRMLENAIKYISTTEHSIQIITRIDTNVAHGIIRAAKELLITDIVIGWNAKRTGKNFFFGSILDSLTKNCNQMILVSKLEYPLNVVSKIVVLIPEEVSISTGFRRALYTIMNLSKKSGGNLLFLSTQNVNQVIKDITKGKDKNLKIDFDTFDGFDYIDSIINYLTDYSLLIILSVRKDDVSYNKSFEQIPEFLADKMNKKSFIVIYPEETWIQNQKGKVVFDSVSVGDEIE